MGEEKKEKRLVEYYQEGAIGIIHLNDPPLNISTKENRKQYGEAVTWAKNNPELRVVIFRNTGKCFGAGADVKAMPNIDINSYNVPRYTNVYERVTDLPMPTIAALDGAAYGGAFERALACDMRIARRDAILCMSEVNFGAIPGSGGVAKLIELMGNAKAMEVMLMPRKDMTAEEWLPYGVVNAVVDDEEKTGDAAFRKAMEWAEIIASKPYSGPRAIKEASLCWRKPRLEPYFKEQQRINTHLCAAGDFKAGANDFFNKDNAFHK
ncbi:enoyl-CoA hydratase/isomerase family protein [Hominifimenecus sp. rT4P-3]|uniref:enoyl-CoA hydratase/isomerase family protein n=1 Tax=Hominifimenecus sp. rT4P-3 TaxID=3242979 RepID=UPI003DA5802F